MSENKYISMTSQKRDFKNRHKQQKKVDICKPKKAVTLQMKITALSNFFSWSMIFLDALSPYNKTSSASH